MDILFKILQILLSNILNKIAEKNSATEKIIEIEIILKVRIIPYWDKPLNPK